MINHDVNVMGFTILELYRTKYLTFSIKERIKTIHLFLLQ